MAIGAEQIVRIIPGVVDSGGNPLDLNGLFVTDSNILPSGSVTSWSTPESVANYFGTESIEYKLAYIYFLGYTNSLTKPSTLYFAQFVDADVAAWLRGNEITQTVVELQEITAGTLTINIDGTEYSLTGVDFSADATFSAMATNLQALLTTAGASGVTVTFTSDFNAFIIMSSVTGALSSVGYATAGTVGEALLLTESLGATKSDGLDSRTIAENMDAFTVTTTNWATFLHTFDQTDDEKIEFATWANGKNLGVRFAYSTWDNSATAYDPTSTTALAKRIDALGLSGTITQYDSKELSAFICAFGASLDFTATNGRATAAFRMQGGLDISVTDGTTADALIKNGYNFYGDYQTDNDAFKWLYPGQISGPYAWVATHLNAIRLNSSFQLAFMTLFANTGSIPYNLSGYDQIRAAAMDPINAALNFGTIRTGVALSEAQKAQVDNAAGITISGILETRGWFLQILDATAQARGNRESPPMTFWYTDGGSVQKIEMGSNVIQ